MGAWRLMMEKLCFLAKSTKSQKRAFLVTLIAFFFRDRSHRAHSGPPTPTFAPSNPRSDRSVVPRPAARHDALRQLRRDRAHEAHVPAQKQEKTCGAVHRHSIGR